MGCPVEGWRNAAAGADGLAVFYVSPGWVRGAARQPRASAFKRVAQRLIGEHRCGEAFAKYEVT